MNNLLNTFCKAKLSSSMYDIIHSSCMYMNILQYSSALTKSLHVLLVKYFRIVYYFTKHFILIIQDSCWNLKPAYINCILFKCTSMVIINANKSLFLKSLQVIHVITSALGNMSIYFLLTLSITPDKMTCSTIGQIPKSYFLTGISSVRQELRSTRHYEFQHSYIVK